MENFSISPSTPHPEELASLVGGFYDASLDERLWAGISDRIAAACRSTSAVVKLHGDRVQLLEMTDNLIVPERLREWADDWHSRDVWVQRSVAFGLSRIVTSHELVPEGEAMHSGFFQEWLPSLDIRHMIGAVFPTNGTTIGVLGVHRPRDAEGYNEEDRKTVAYLLPHLQRALQLGQRLQQVSLAQQVTLETLDALDAGVLLVDATGRVIHANAIAEAMTADGSELIIRHGRLDATTSRLRRSLTAAIRDAAALAGGEASLAGASIRIERPGRAAWTLAVSPLRPRWDRLAYQQPMALVLMRDPEYPPLLIERLRDLFGLTRSQALVAAELGRGHGPAEIAAALGVALGTVRTHIKAVFQKTETSRQAEAVAAIRSSVAAMRGA